MPFLNETSYPLWGIFKNGHFNTIYKTISAHFKINYTRKRLFTDDDDFIDLDISSVSSKRVVIVIHGLEGSSKSSYILALTHYLNSKNTDVIAVNLRGCSGEPNKKLQTYHSGKTDDLDFIIKHVVANYNYNNINIVGFSLGGNLTLKYMGEYADKIPSLVKRAVAISAPCSLEDSSIQLAKPASYIYMAKFLKSLKIKALEKIDSFPNSGLNKEAILASKNFHDFDNVFTAPVFGYKSAQEYWHKNSSLGFLSSINKPTLLINALDDPFLMGRCYPFEIAKKHSYFSFLPTTYGGHVGFNSTFNKYNNLWVEQRVLNFLNDECSTSQ